MTNQEFVVLFDKGLLKLRDEVLAYPGDAALWIVLPGTINSGGNLVQHLIGNLRTYIGLELGGVSYVRDRDAEFGKRLFTQDGLLSEIDILRKILEATLSSLTPGDLEKEYSREVLGLFSHQRVALILSHLLSHLGYHTGQINYHRRIMTETF